MTMTGNRAAGRRRGPRMSVAAAVAVALLTTASGTVRAADYADGRDWNRGGDTLSGAVGLHVGKIGGTGLAFRLPLQWFLYGQVAGGIWHTQDDQRHNLGVQAQYLLRQDTKMRLFTAIGAAAYYRRQRTGVTADGDVWQTKTDWNYGAGLGIEMLQGPRWAWLAELDFVHEERTGNTTVSPQAGISYYW